MLYELIIKPTAEKCLDKLPRPIRQRVVDALKHLQNNPRPTGAIKLVGEENFWRIRIGNYRVVYEIHDKQLLILVLRVAHRKDAYRP
jgi:mRNA interferase RelE/StbE